VNEAVMTYFTGEKNVAVMLMIAAAIGFVVAAALMPVRWGLRPLAITLAVFAAIELAIGLGLYLRTDP
jgi:hypothetical protein